MKKSIFTFLLLFSTGKAFSSYRPGEIGRAIGEEFGSSIGASQEVSYLVHDVADILSYEALGASREVLRDNRPFKTNGAFRSIW